MPRRASPKQSAKMPPRQKSPTTNPELEKSIQTEIATADSQKHNDRGPGTPESMDNGSHETKAKPPSTPTKNNKRPREEDTESTQETVSSSNISCPGCRKSLDSYELLGRHVASCHLLQTPPANTKDDTNYDDGDIDTSTIPKENIISQHGDVVLIALRVDHRRAIQASQDGTSNGEEAHNTNESDSVQTLTNEPMTAAEAALMELDWSDDGSLYDLAESVASGESDQSEEITALLEDFSDTEDSMASGAESYDSDLEDSDWDDDEMSDSGSDSEDTHGSRSSTVDEDVFDGFDWTEMVEEIPEHWEPEALPYRPDAEIQPNQMFLVSSQVLIAGSPVFASMLNQDSKFSEGERLRRISGRKPITITLDDDADTLSLVLKILHHSNSKLPDRIDLYQMRNLAILVDKYQLHESMQLRADVWAEPLRKKHPNNLNWLVISWTFGYDKEFRAISEVIADRFVLRDEQLQFSASESPRGPWVKLLESTPTIVVERLESLVQSRRQALIDILHSIRTVRTSIPSHEAYCTRPRMHHVDRRSCDLLQIGSMVKEFATHDAFSFLRSLDQNSNEEEKPDGYIKSVLELVESLCCFVSEDLREIEESWNEHMKCSWVGEMRAKVAKFAVQSVGLGLADFPSRRELGFGKVDEGAVAAVEV